MEQMENPLEGSYATKAVFASCDEFGQRAAARACNRAKQLCGMIPTAREVQEEEADTATN